MTLQLWWNIMVGVFIIGAHLRIDALEKRKP